MDTGSNGRRSIELSLRKGLEHDRLMPSLYGQAADKLVEARCSGFVLPTRQWYSSGWRRTLSQIQHEMVNHMLYLGIDIGKYNYVISMISNEKKVVYKAFSFSDSSEGDDKLLEQLDRV